MNSNPESGLPNRYPPIAAGRPYFLHGGDYSPEQWAKHPEVIEEDFRLTEAARVNTFTIGVFSWTALEPAEGKFEFGWMDRIMDRMAQRNMAAVLATPSGARPAWMSQKYPEVLRVKKDGLRNRHEGRHNHCLTSPVYREKVAIIDSKLAERYHDHPALAIWHISNEFSGECHCNLCYSAFRLWLQKRYRSLEEVNDRWFTAFWSHTFTDWNQIEPVDYSIDGLKLDWKRFVTDQTRDFMRQEIVAVRKYSQAPTTTNMMGTFEGIDYWKFAPELDIASWDAYPWFHDRDDTIRVAAQTAFAHDLTRCLKGGRPFMLMENSPSAQNWAPVNKLKSPGMHKLACLQAVAHGADTVQYFQWRKNRGSCEKFHGAVIDHVGHERTRVFDEVADLGRTLEKLPAVIGTVVPAQAAVIYDWENRWALEGASGPRNEKKYADTCEMHYRALWSMGVPADVINSDQPLDRYKLVVVPMLYMVRPGVAERFEKFVQGGGTLVATYLSGIVDETDLNFLGGWPGPLRPLLGIWSEEIDALYDDEHRAIKADPASGGFGLSGPYSADTFCDLIHAESAKTLATYSDGFYANRPALTVNRFGSGQAFYLAARFEERLLSDLYTKLVADAKVQRAVNIKLPPGVSAQLRQGGNEQFLFLLNFSRQPQILAETLHGYSDAVTGVPITSPITLGVNGSLVLRKTIKG